MEVCANNDAGVLKYAADWASAACAVVENDVSGDEPGMVMKDDANDDDAEADDAEAEDKDSARLEVEDAATVAVVVDIDPDAYILSDARRASGAAAPTQPFAVFR